MILPSVFFILFFSYDWFFLMFSTSLLKASLCSSILLSLVSIFMTISLNSLSSKLLVCFNRFVLEFHFVLLFRTYPSASSCCLTLSDCFNELGKTGTSPGFISMDLHKGIFCVNNAPGSFGWQAGWMWSRYTLGLFHVALHQG